MMVISSKKYKSVVLLGVNWVILHLALCEYSSCWLIEESWWTLKLIQITQ